MKFTDWYIPGRGTSPNKAQIRISRNLISLTRFTINTYFGEKKHARIGYDEERDILLIKPATEEDSLGLKLIGRDNSNFIYINAKNFISDFKLMPEGKQKSKKYDCKWDENNECLIVENVKK
jgi:hypothetical protein